MMPITQIESDPTAAPREHHLPAGDVVWDRVWKHTPDDARDDEALGSERESQRWSLVVDRLTRQFGALEGLRTIELGSGRGDMSVLLAERGANVTLLDCNVKALSLADERFDRLGLPASFVSGDLLGDLQAFAGAYDVALSLGVAEHFRADDRTQVLSAHRDVLHNRGLAVISVPHAWCPPYRIWKSYLEMRGWWPYGMELPYGRRELRGRAEKAGFGACETMTMRFWQSMACLQSLLRPKQDVDWLQCRSWLDGWFGADLLMFAWADQVIDGEH